MVGTAGVAEVNDIDSELVPRYVPQKKLTRNIKVSPTMALDHLPDRIYLALRNMLPKVQKEIEQHQQRLKQASARTHTAPSHTNGPSTQELFASSRDIRWQQLTARQSQRAVVHTV